MLIGSEASHAEGASQAQPHGTTPADELGDDLPAEVEVQEETAHSSTGLWMMARRNMVSIAAAVVVFAVLVVGLLLLISAWDQASSLKSVSAARSSALAAARTYAQEVGSYNYKSLTQDFVQVETHSTASFRTKFENSTGSLSPVLTRYHAVATAKVVAAGLESATTDQAVAVVFINQTASNTAQKGGPTSSQSRLEITLVRQHGEWLIDNLKLL